MNVKYNVIYRCVCVYMETNMSKPKINKIGDKKGLKRDPGERMWEGERMHTTGKHKGVCGRGKVAGAGREESTIFGNNMPNNLYVKNIKNVQDIQRNTNKELNNIVWK